MKAKNRSAFQDRISLTKAWIESLSRVITCIWAEISVNKKGYTT